jgi:hypothetical protein
MLIKEPIHGVVVSVGYADYLEISLTHNRPMFGHCVVATSPDDKESQRVAGRHACDVVITEVAKRRTQDGKGFNKGAMIERALNQLPGFGWRIHFDADIVFPGNMLSRLTHALHDKEAIYGVDRMNVVNWEGYERLVGSGFTSRGFEHHHFLNHSIDRSEVGSRLVHHDEGWAPIGYWQCWHHDSEYSGMYRVRGYAAGSNSAARDDVQFALRWDRHKRILIPEFYVAHLVTDDSRYGANWKGRKTRPFAPPKNRPSTPLPHGYGA